LHAFHMVLSHSRQDAIVWMPNENQLSWLEGRKRPTEHRLSPQPLRE